MTQKMFLLTAFLFSCSEQKFHSIDESEDSVDETERVAEGPAIEVAPMSLNYGTLNDTNEVVEQFVISSVGELDLELSTVDFSTDAGGFTILTTELNDAVLPPGTSVEVDVAFSAEAAEASEATILVGSNDEENPSVPVDLQVDVYFPGPQLLINPDPLDMGVTPLGCEADNEVELKNIGDADLEITEIEHTGTTLTMESTPDLPLTLAPDETAMVYFSFEPDAVEEVSGTLTVVSNEPAGTRDALQTGSGVMGSEYVDEWEVPLDPPSDIVFFVDQSCSMDDDQTSLATNFSTFISELTSYSSDWQIIVANQDSGCNSTSGVLHPDLPESTYVSRFQSGVREGADGLWGYFYTEAGLTVTSEAIQMTDAGECNYGFLRPEAMLHIIMVSDEHEQSIMNWDFYVDKIIAKKGSASQVKFSAVAGDYPSGCATAEPGTGYYEAVSTTGGVFLSICSEWATPDNLATLAAASIQQTAYELSETPNVDTIKVFVDEVEREGGWYFDGPTNTVIFETDIPNEGSTIRVTYAGPADCD